MNPIRSAGNEATGSGAALGSGQEGPDDSFIVAGGRGVSAVYCNDVVINWVTQASGTRYVKPFTE